ncbi:MAG TPA: carbon-nitrogen family hydrolase [Humisphaera sp.]
MNPTVAAVQFDIAWEDKPANYRTASEAVRKADLPAGSLVILPEMFATGFSMNAAKTEEPPHGPTFDFLASMAKHHDLYVLAGVVQKGPDGRPRNEALAIDPAGRLLARYAKMHPFALGGEKVAYAAGTEVVQFDWHGVRVTPFICYDLRFPELFRRAARRGTDLFAVIASWPNPRTHHWTSLLLARAIENQAYVVGNNRTGADPALTYDGRSQIIDFAGTIVADADVKPGVIRAGIDPDALRAWRNKLPFLQDMRDDLHPAG